MGPLYATAARTEAGYLFSPHARSGAVHADGDAGRGTCRSRSHAASCPL